MKKHQSVKSEMTYTDRGIWCTFKLSESHWWQ